MRRLLLTGPALALLVLLAGCGGGSTRESATVTVSKGPIGSIGPLGPTPTCAGAPATAPVPPGSTTNLATKPVVIPPGGPPPCELQTIDLVVGKGAQAVDGSQVAVKYVGLLYQGGTEFDSSWKRSPTETLPFAIGSGVIPGFSNGTRGMRVGGRREILIPSKDGYGDQGTGPIPPGADLIFVVDRVKVG